MIRATTLRLSTIATLVGNWYRLHFAEPSTKFCPRCGSTVVVPLRSINMKICNNCTHEFTWKLDPGQKPLQAPSRADRKRVTP